MEIKKGYKMTDVGVIPEDWEVKSIGEVLSICNGMDYKHLNRGNYPVYGTGGLIARVDDFLFEGESVCIGRKGTIDTPIYLNEKFWTVDTLFYSINFVGVIPKFIYYIFNTIDWLSLNEASGVPSLSKDNIKLQLIQIPNLSEQQAIADALTKVDNLIMSLSKVIEKKKLIKKGTMQKLLSGEVRLDGYNNIIKSVNLSDIGEIKAGGTPSTNVPSYWGGTINWLQSGAVKNRVLDIRDVEKTITYDGLASSSAYLIKENSVLIAITGATCGNIAYLPFKSAANQSVVAIQVNVGFNSKYIFYMLIQNSDKIVNNRGGSAQGGVAVNILKEIELCIHEDIDEQTAIADILTTMDNEIEALEKERDKYKCIKQGMMQQLLTGKIRLICQ